MKEINNKNKNKSENDNDDDNMIIIMTNLLCSNLNFCN
jgi:hypothetical protein